jgi:hypothetical protein
MGLGSAKLESRPYGVNTTGARTWGITIRGIDAAQVGAVNTAVLRFAGAPTITRRLASNQTAATSNLADPATILTTADNGTTVQLFRPGLWAITVSTGLISVAAASRLTAVLSIDAAAGELVVAGAPTVKNGDTALDDGDAQAVAGVGAAVPIKLYGNIVIPEGARPIIRVLVTNGAAAAPAAGTVRVNTSIDLCWLRDRAA